MAAPAMASAISDTMHIDSSYILRTENILSMLALIISTAW